MQGPRQRLPIPFSWLPPSTNPNSDSLPIPLTASQSAPSKGSLFIEDLGSAREKTIRSPFGGRLKADLGTVMSWERWVWSICNSRLGFSPDMRFWPHTKTPHKCKPWERLFSMLGSVGRILLKKTTIPRCDVLWVSFLEREINGRTEDSYDLCERIWGSLILWFQMWRPAPALIQFWWPLKGG